jgi:hypothetical protein
VKRVSGPVALIGRPSSDKRVLAADGGMLPSGWIPILALPPRRDQRRFGHVGAALVGRGMWAVDDDLLFVNGVILDESQVAVPVGRYPCGLDFECGSNDSEMQRGGTVVFHSWVGRAVTIHLDGGANAFDVEDLEVSEE